MLALNTVLVGLAHSYIRCRFIETEEGAARDTRTRPPETSTHHLRHEYIHVLYEH